MNQNAEEFREITMKVLTMQLASTTIMDLVAYGGAGNRNCICSKRPGRRKDHRDVCSIF